MTAAATIVERVSCDEKWLLEILRALPYGKVVVTKQAGAIVTAEKQEMLKPPQ